VISRDADPSNVATVKAQLGRTPGVLGVAVDTPVSVDGWNDPESGDQWALQDLNMTGPLLGVPDGSAVKVAVLDTGIMANHEDLEGRVRCDLGADFTDDQAIEDPARNGCVDPHGHGTHVAGTIGAVSGNGIGVTGMSAAQLIPVRVLDADGWGSSSGIVAGMRWAVDHGASIISMSLGGDSNELYDDAVKYAMDHNVVVLAAAGNNRLQGNALHYPGATPGVFAVASLAESGVSSSFSYSGPTNLITAPGSDIVSTTHDGGYGWMSGTSMATPHVAGVLARYRQEHPDATVAQVRAAVASTAIDIETPGKDNNTGYGLLDAYELLTGHQSPARTWVTAPGEPTNLRTTAGPSSVVLTWGTPLFTGGSPLYGFTIGVYRGDTATSAGLVRYQYPTAGQRSFTITGLTPGAHYSFLVWAWNVASEFNSNPAYTTAPVVPLALQKPGAPRIGTPTVGGSAVLVRWAAPLSNGGAALTKYTVSAYRGTSLVKSVAAAPSATALTVTGLTNGYGYTFAVTATNAVGTGVASAHTATVAPRTLPGAPRIGSPSRGVRAVTVRWAAPASNGGSAVTGYYVRTYRGSAVVKTVWVRAGQTGVVVSGLASRVGYRFAVAAINAAGTGPGSALTGTVLPR
jgi:subtilisin family serine protease